MSDLFTFCKHPDQPVEAEADLCEACLPWLGFVKVEPCEHGNFAGHPVEHTIRIVYSTLDGRVEYTKMDYMLCGGTPEATDV